MLNRLVIHDVVLIEKLAVTFGEGLNVFTGETGAGKSILLDALGLALGERSDANLIRHGASQASVIAEFTLADHHPVFALAVEQGLSLENPVLLRRVISKDGKSRAFLNDQPISIGLLRQFGDRLLEIHGQFETHGLLNPSTHRHLLDLYAGLKPLCAQTATAYAAWKTAEETQRQAVSEAERARGEEDFLRLAVRELDELDPQSGETDQLAQRRTHLQHREKIVEALQVAEHCLNGEKGAVSSLAQAGKALARVLDKAEDLHSLLVLIDRVAEDANEAVQQLERYMAGLDADPETLQQIEERLFALRAMARKHNVLVDLLPETRQQLAERLTLLTDQGDQLNALAKKTTQARQAYMKFANDLSGKRRTAAQQLQKAIAHELPPLKLDRAHFVVDVVQLSEEQASSEGVDQVLFRAATNPGSPAGPLQKVASGGELSRFMLALKVVLTTGETVQTLVFDEIDTGIGGATASAVGERLARLAEQVQILVVTHSPQVAARGTYHLRVSKSVKTGQTVTTVDPLSAQERREEIARMLAGAEITEAAREAADSLLIDTPEFFETTQAHTSPKSIKAKARK